jgi:tetratricopeptide (TPR) repeat protein
LLSSRADEIKIELKLDPLFLIGRLNLAESYWFAGQRDSAWKEINAVLQIEPNFLGGLLYVRLFHIKERNWEGAIAAQEKILEINPGFIPGKALLGHVYGKIDERSKALQIFNELKELSKQKYVSAFFTAVIFTGLEDKDSAFRWLDKAIEQRDREM